MARIRTVTRRQSPRRSVVREEVAKSSRKQRTTTDSRRSKRAGLFRRQRFQQVNRKVTQMPEENLEVAVKVPLKGVVEEEGRGGSPQVVIDLVRAREALDRGREVLPEAEVDLDRALDPGPDQDRQDLDLEHQIQLKVGLAVRPEGPKVGPGVGPGQEVDRNRGVGRDREAEVDPDRQTEADRAVEAKARRHHESPDPHPRVAESLTRFKNPFTINIPLCKMM